MRTDEQLMESYVSSDDQVAFTELYARHAPLLRRIVARQVYRADVVDDLLQQTFLQLHLARHRYRTGAPLKPWLCAIASNLCLDHLRKRSRQAERELDLDQTAGSDVQTDLVAESSAPLLQAFASLSEPTQRVFREHIVLDRPLAEIARELGTKASTLRVRLHRGRQELRAQLAAG